MNGHDWPELTDPDGDNDPDDAMAEALLRDPVFRRDLEEGEKRTRNIERLVADFEREIDAGKTFSAAWGELTAGMFRHPEDQRRAERAANEALLDELCGKVEGF